MTPALLPASPMAFMGVGPMELLILGVLVCGGVGVAAVVLIAALAGRNRAGSNPNLVPCPDCERMVSRHATACPQCGRPLPPS
jgi:hypothetical protein